MRKMGWWKTVCTVCVVCTATVIALPAQTYKVLYSFTGGADGANPIAGLAGGAGGRVYGTTNCDYCTSGYGTVFELAQTGETTLYAFMGGTDGGNPYSGVVPDAAGNLYGTEFWGGRYGGGTLFKVDAAGNETVLHTFGAKSPSGTGPIGGVIRDGAGNLYGTTYYGGDLSCGGGFGCGTVFMLSKAGEEKVLYSFAGGSDGTNPEANLILDSAGNLYGTTDYGGATSCLYDGVFPGCGTVFKVDRAGKETVLCRFQGGTDGAIPFAGLVRDTAGSLYGTTYQGGGEGGSICGGYGCGIVFKIDTTGTETVLHRFGGYPTDGAVPFAGLVIDPGGNLYGTTQSGGASNLGTVFELDTTGTQTVLYSFTGADDGEQPDARLLRDAAGNLYGTTYYGGAYGFGVVFRLTR
jgi:uncharacterized repeat protein (TIGR03803 family)